MYFCRPQGPSHSRPVPARATVIRPRVGREFPFTYLLWPGFNVGKTRVPSKVGRGPHAVDEPLTLAIGTGAVLGASLTTGDDRLEAWHPPKAWPREVWSEVGDGAEEELLVGNLDWRGVEGGDVVGDDIEVLERTPQRCRQQELEECRRHRCKVEERERVRCGREDGLLNSGWTAITGYEGAVVRRVKRATMAIVRWRWRACQHDRVCVGVDKDRVDAIYFRFLHIRQ